MHDSAGRYQRVPGSPYQGIVERNVFGLKAPAPPPDPEANKPPPPKIFLTGITTILGNKRALMKLTPPAKPGEPAKEQSFTLGEGQRDGELEVLEIDEKAGTVKVNEFGTVMTLSFENNGVKAGPAPAPGGAPPSWVCAQAGGQPICANRCWQSHGPPFAPANPDRSCPTSSAVPTARGHDASVFRRDTRIWRWSSCLRKHNGRPGGRRRFHVARQRNRGPASASS